MGQKHHVWGVVEDPEGDARGSGDGEAQEVQLGIGDHLILWTPGKIQSTLSLSSIVLVPEYQALLLLSTE